MTEKRWTVISPEEERCKALSDALQIRQLYCQLLVQRKIYTFEEAKNFFRPSLHHLHDPWKMKDMAKAVQRIDVAINKGEKILIYGDYDVDGTTAVATVYSFIHERYRQTGFYIPHRYHEGYGISFTGIDFAKKNNYSLIVTLDCGIKAIDKINYAQSLGIDVIVCDHHLPPQAPSQSPPGGDEGGAYAILNPKQPDCNYPYKELSGCGIGFKLISALACHWKLADDNVFQYLDLVATSIAADIVPITGENRTLAYFGLKKVNKDPLPGIKALAELSGLKKTMQISDLVFMIAPRVNAAGRMDDPASTQSRAHKAVELFIEKDPEKAMALAEILHQDNAHRKDLDKSITEEILAEIAGSEKLISRRSTVLFNKNWHKGVIGIVASRIMETYYRPTIIFTQSNGQLTGSARSVRGFNIYEALHQCHELLDNYGGHFFAAGMTLKLEKFAAFSEKFEEVVSSTIDRELLIPEIRIEAEIRLREITPRLFKLLQQFEPFGPENMRPVFLAKNVYDNGYSKIVSMKHIRFEVKQNNGEGCSEAFTGIGFNLAHKFDIVASGNPFDMCFTVNENEWNGKTSLQLQVIDIKSSKSKELSSK